MPFALGNRLDYKNRVILENGSCSLFPVLKLFTTQSRLLTTPRKKPFENIVGKGENAGNQHFLLFPQCFLPYQRQELSFELHLFCRLQMLSIWSRPKNCRLVKSKKIHVYFICIGV